MLAIQLLGVVAIAIFTVAFSFLMFGGLKAIGRLRVNPEADGIGIDAYEHGASVWPDVYAIAEPEKITLRLRKSRLLSANRASKLMPEK